MKIALTGASGFIGSHVARVATRHGHDVVALVRETSNRTHIEDVVSSFVVGSHDDKDAQDKLVDGADVVIHDSFDWKALKEGSLKEHLKVNLESSIELLRKSKGKHFIYMSSIAVHHHMHDKWAGVIDTTHPTRPGSLYGACKAAVEAHLWAANASHQQEFSAIRPCAVYGFDPSIKRSIGHPIIETIKHGKPYERTGGGKFVHVDDVAEATVACIDNSNATPKVYNLVDCYARWADWAKMIAEELGVDATINDSSPNAPANSFDTADVSNDLGVMLNRGTDGIHAFIKELVHA